MGFRMVKALDSRKKPVTLSMIEERPEPFVRPLQCAYCTRPATTASSCTRRTPGGGTTTVSAYFRLLGQQDSSKPETEACTFHQADCEHPGRVSLTSPAEVVVT